MRAALLLLFSLSAAFGDTSWEIGFPPSDQSRAYIAISNHGYGSLKEAIAAFPSKAKGASLYHIWMGLFIDADSKSQLEIKSYLQKHYSDSLKAALKSSGNMHNPKITPLVQPFEQAVLHTSLVTTVSDELAKIGYKVSGVSSEKFSIDKSSGTFSAMVWIQTQKTEQGAAANP